MSDGGPPRTSKGLQLDRCNKKPFPCSTLSPQRSPSSRPFSCLMGLSTQLSTQLLNRTRETPRCICGRVHCCPGVAHIPRLFQKSLSPNHRLMKSNFGTIPDGLEFRFVRLVPLEHISSHEFRDLSPGLSALRNLEHLSLYFRGLSNLNPQTILARFSSLSSLTIWYVGHECIHPCRFASGEAHFAKLSLVLLALTEPAQISDSFFVRRETMDFRVHR